MRYTFRGQDARTTRVLSLISVPHNNENCCNLPITNYQSPISNYQLPISNYQSPITNYDKQFTRTK
ncbi:hypothetical protein [Sphaerospermopsis sp. LEGE 08334]|uniref:hypothetical protein n=1 Tax=Sphaerospermopsis sp. LEGE 08334 TaxID=1828651 RepID=UPI00187E7B9D|nr:hypothetical protein [Sphaerospermopsis sp. LEGE 08334]MBE9058390.1 hypothetical protein [Sphaerospermopsis sp. LEGE 08334]